MSLILIFAEDTGSGPGPSVVPVRNGDDVLVQNGDENQVYVAE